MFTSLVQIRISWSVDSNNGAHYERYQPIVLNKEEGTGYRYLNYNLKHLQGRSTLISPYGQSWSLSIFLPFAKTALDVARAGSDMSCSHSHEHWNEMAKTNREY